MTFKSKEQPLCRCCGRRIKKRVTTVYVRDINKRAQSLHSGWEKYLYLQPSDFPRTKAQCQKLTNEKVISVSYHNVYASGEPCGREVWSFNTWDGESYDDEHFDTNECAKRWGYVMAHSFPDKVSAAYNAAIAKRRGKEKVE